MEIQFIEPEMIVSDEKTYQPASYIRKNFILDQTVKKATLYMTALGVYKAYFNGKEVDQQYLLPGFTNYRKRVQYQTYDITDELHIGENVIAVILGDGWYRGSLGAYSIRHYYGDKIKFAAVLKLEIGDEIRWVKSDESWKATQNGAVRQNDIKTYETVDMMKELTELEARKF